MAEQDLNKLKQTLEELESQLTSISVKIGVAVKSQTTEMDAATKKVAQQYANNFNAAVNKVKKNFEDQYKLQKDLQGKSGKEEKALLEKLSQLKKKADFDLQTAIRQTNQLKGEGIFLDQEDLEVLLEKNKGLADSKFLTEEYIKELQDAEGPTDIIRDGIEGFANSLDKSGNLAKILNGGLTKTQALLFASAASLALLVKGTFDASANIANIAKNTGVSADEATRLQTEFKQIASDSDKIFITSERLNQAFAELSSQTGLIADFGGNTLETQATLTKQLGLSAEAAGKLSLLARLQGENTENTLSSVVKTVGAISSQNGVALNAKTILEDISQISDAIAVSLGKNPVELAEAAAKARIFGTSLEQIDAIAGQLLDFESSISAELEAQLLTGQNINLSKARALALDNDLVGLSEELAKQQGIINSFATGNRIQQEAAATALGMSRDELAKIALQQEFNNLSAEQFRATYGDVTYEQLQAQSAGEKFADVLTKIQGIIADFAIAFAPILDGIAEFASRLAQSKGLAVGLTSALTVLAGLSIANGIGSIFAGLAKLGLPGVALATAATAAMLSSISQAKASIADDMVIPAGYGNTVIKSPKGTIALNNQDSVVAGTNLFGGGGNAEAKETNRLLKEYLSRGTQLKVGATNFNNQQKVYGYSI